MTQIHREALVPYTPKQMFDLVVDVEAFPNYFDWCERAEVKYLNDTTLEGRLFLKYGALRTSFATRNVLTEPSEMTLTSIDGPFKSLDGVFRFDPLGDEANPQGCKVTLELSFSMSNPLLGAAIGLGFGKLADRMVDDFVAVAHRHYQQNNEPS